MAEVTFHNSSSEKPAMDWCLTVYGVDNLRRCRNSVYVRTLLRTPDRGPTASGFGSKRRQPASEDLAVVESAALGPPYGDSGFYDAAIQDILAVTS